MTHYASKIKELRERRAELIKSIHEVYPEKMLYQIPSADLQKLPQFREWARLGGQLAKLLMAEYRETRKK